MRILKIPRLFALLGVALSLALGCEKRNSTPLGYDELRREISDPASLFLNRPSRDTSYSALVPAGSSTSILAGTFQGYEAKALLRFEVSDTVVTNHATLAKIRLRRQNRLGTEPLDISLCTLAESWEERWSTWTEADSATPWTTPGGAVSDTIASATIGEIDSLTFTIPGSELPSVIEPSNKGLILVCGSNSIADFCSRETDTPPLLFVHYFRGGEAEVDTLVPVADAYIIYTDYEVPEGRLIVGNGHVFRTLIQFDLSSIPQGATVNYGTLELSIDTPESSFETMNLAAYRLTGEWNGNQTPFDDASSSAVKVTSSETSVRFDVASLLQGCVSAEDWGLLIRSSSEFSDISRIAFFSGEADSANRPRLAIYYTLPPGFRG